MNDELIQEIVNNLDGAINRGHLQADMIIMYFAKPSTRFHTGGQAEDYDIGIKDALHALT